MGNNYVRRALIGAALGICTLASASAFAAPGRIQTVVRKLGPEHAVLGAQTLFLNRCVSGCTVRSGTDDATTNTSSIATNGSHTILESSKLDDEQWAALVLCVQQVYSPYAITVTDQLPTTQYNEEIIAGSPDDIGYDAPAGVEGVAIVSPDCTPGSNLIAFTFLDQQASDDNDDIVLSTCWTASQESAHLYGLDHEYQFTDGMSACSDPMTYRTDCGGQKFFRNKFASCGEFGPARPGCGPTNACATTQNSHAKLLDVLGPGTPTTTAPDVSVLNPAAGATIVNGAPVFAMASAQRGVANLTLNLNGYPWATATGVPFGADGQPASEYQFTLPQNVPDGIIDITVVASDDLGVSTTSDVVTVTKGAPCADATTCAKGQACDAGKCEWPPAAGKLGDSCTYPQFCTSGECEGTSTTDQFCTTDCVPGITGTCTDGYECVMATATAGFCLKPSSGGCATTGAGGVGGAQVATQAGFMAVVLAMLFRRRRRG